MSAGGYLNGCGFIPVSTGTGDFVVSAAVQGYATPATSGAVNTTVYTYRAESADKSQWEIGFGAYTVSTTTLARTTILLSSTGAKVSFSAAPNVFVTAATADLQNASLLISGTLQDALLSGNVPLRNAANTFTGSQKISSASSGWGYTTGAGGTVSQATNKATGVTLNAASGHITMNAAALAAGAIVTFNVTDGIITAGDVVIANHFSGGTTGAYTINARENTGGNFAVDVRNNTSGSLSEAIVIAFAIIKGSTT